MKVSIIGCGNVGVALAADLSIGGHEVSVVKTTQTNTETFEEIRKNGNSLFIKEEGQYRKAVISKLTYDLSEIANADVVFVTIQSTYHEHLIKKMSRYLRDEQIVVVICSYMSSCYFKKYCSASPIIAETAGPYLEGRVETNDLSGEIVFRVGCRLSRSPMSVSPVERADECMEKLSKLYDGMTNEYSVIESALLNPNMVLHTVGSIMSIPRIEYSDGVFCMYREAYSRKNEATMRIMLSLDEEKKKVLKALGCHPVDIFNASSFVGDPVESFYEYSESSDRALSPTSVRSRYITEDVSQGLVLFESIAKRLGIATPIATSMIDIAGAALGRDFRSEGRTIEKMGVTDLSVIG